MNQELRLVGKIKEAHGLRGELYVLVFSGETEWLSGLKEIWLSADEGQSFEPLKLKKTKPHKQGFIANSEALSDRTAAEAKKGLLVYIPTDLLRSKPGENIFLAEIEGFEVIDARLGRLGTVEGFGTNSIQDLIAIHDKGELIGEVPLVEAFLEKIDFENEKVYMNLPEGLIGNEEE